MKVNKSIIKAAPSDVLEVGKYTYINLYNYSLVRKYIANFDGVHFDGVGLLNIYRIFKFRSVKRFSADNTSLMPIIKTKFDNYVVCGGNIAENAKFCSEFLAGKNIVYALDGYHDNNKIINEVNNIIDNLPSDFRCIILLGLGSPKQEIIASDIDLKNKQITLLTMGGYISQYYVRAEYFPPIINRLHLRMPYRLVKEGLWNRLPKYFSGFAYFMVDLIISRKIN